MAEIDCFAPFGIAAWAHYLNWVSVKLGMQIQLPVQLQLHHTARNADNVIAAQKQSSLVSSLEAELPSYHNRGF